VEVEGHLFKLEDLFAKLAAAGKKLDEDFKVAIILSSLPESYDVLTTALESRSDDDLTIVLVNQKLIDESRKRGTHEEALVDGSKALKIMDKRNVECYYCHQKGHVKNRCYKWLELKEKKKQEKVQEELEILKMHLNLLLVLGSNKKFFEELEICEKKISIADGKAVRCIGIGSGRIEVVNPSGHKVKLLIRKVMYVCSRFKGKFVISSFIGQIGISDYV
jgi:hypothetical protein